MLRVLKWQLLICWAAFAVGLAPLACRCCSVAVDWKPPVVLQVSRVGHHQCAGIVESHPPRSGELALVRCSCTLLALSHSMVSRQACQQSLFRRIACCAVICCAGIM